MKKTCFTCQKTPAFFVHYVQQFLMLGNKPTGSATFTAAKWLLFEEKHLLQQWLRAGNRVYGVISFCHI